MTDQLASQIRNAPTLPSLPAIAIQVLDLTQRPNADIVEIARAISKDPALSGKILRTVNSSFYGRCHNVSTISHALVILGLQSVKTLVLGFSLVNSLAKDPARGFNHIQYWKHSIFAATSARAMAARIGLVEQEEAFLAALLSDIGMLVLDQVLGEPYGRLHEKIRSHHDLPAAEQQTLGTTHAEVGGMLADIWKLPPMLRQPIAHHHDPQKVADPALRKLCEVVALAGRCADVFVDAEAAAAIADVRQRFLHQLKLGEADCDAVMADIGNRTNEVAGLFELNIDSVAEYEAILKKANETLVELTLQSQQQATELAEHNEMLQQQATLDGLTGLQNRARFDAFLADQFAASVKGGRPMALLMIDLDRFKSINDRLGHPGGDAVLKAVARVLAGAARKTDAVFRYGGEEMAVVMPAADRASAAKAAEGFRRAVAARPIIIGNNAVMVTASIGVAVLEPGCPFRVPAHLLKAADLAVYNAKHSGRNCVRVFALKPSVSKPAADAAQPATAASALHAHANATDTAAPAAPTANSTGAPVHAPA